MALDNEIVWEVRTAGSDTTNGGGFNSTASGTDRSQSDSPFVTIDGVTITATVHTTTSQLILAGYTVVSADVGNIVNISGGTATAGLYEITAIDAGNNRWTVDRSTGTAAQTATGGMGGALASPGMIASASLVSGATIHIKSGTYTFSSTANGSGGRLNITTGGTTALPIRWIGYQTTREDGGTKPIFQSGDSSITLVTVGAAGHIFDNLEVKRNTGSHTSVRGWRGNSQGTWRNCKATSCDDSGFYTQTATSFYYNCEATGCDIGWNITAAVQLFRCVAQAGTGTGFAITTASCRLAYCIASKNAGRGFDVQSNAELLINCTSDGNTGANGTGFDVDNSVQNTVLINCLATNNAQRGFEYGSAATGMQFFYNCAGYNNTAGNHNLPAATVFGFITVTADPYTNQSSNDYSLNNTAAGGGLLRGDGQPGSFPGLSTTGYTVVGAVQGDASSAGASVYKSAVGRWSF